MQIVLTKKPISKLIEYLISYTPHTTHYRPSLLCPFTASSIIVIAHHTQNYIYNTSQVTSTFILTHYLSSCSLNNSVFVIYCVSMFCLLLMRSLSALILLIIPGYLFVFGCESRYLQCFCIVNILFNSTFSCIVLLFTPVING